MRRRARTDANHADIREALRKAGWTVIDMSRVGGGFPDLLAARHGVIRLIEVKDGALPPSARKLTEDERKLHDLLDRADVRVHVVTSLEEAVHL